MKNDKNFKVGDIVIHDELYYGIILSKSKDYFNCYNILWLSEIMIRTKALPFANKRRLKKMEFENEPEI